MEKIVVLNSAVENLSNFAHLKAIGYNGFCYLHIAKEKELLKRGNPLRDARVTESYGLQVMLNACNYYDKQSNKGNNIPTEERQKQTGRSPLIENFVDISDRDGTNYLRAYLIDGKYKTDVTYFVNGKEATPDEVEIIKQFSKKSAPRDPKNNVEMVGYKFDNIVSYKVNGTLYVLNHKDVQYKTSKDIALQA